MPRVTQMLSTEPVGLQSWHRLCPSSSQAAVAYILGCAEPILTVTLAGKDCTQPHLADEKYEVQRDDEVCQEGRRRSGALPTKARPTHEVMDILSSASCFAMTLLPNRLVLPSLNPSSRGRLERCIHKPSKRSPFSFCPTHRAQGRGGGRPGGPGEMAHAISSLANRGQQSNTRGQVWGPWEAQPSLLQLWP